jgi:hypothetical protein
MLACAEMGCNATAMLGRLFAMKVMKHIYGSVTLEKATCPDCRRRAIILDGKFQCCDRVVSDPEPGGYKRESSAVYRRTLPPKPQRDAVLKRQRNCCFYCRRPLLSFIVTPRGKLKRLTIHWDHKVPFHWDANNAPENFVAACCQCNLWKSGKTFNHVDEARVFIAQKLEEYTNRLH